MQKSERPHIGIFGRRNNGKSSLINVLAGQDVAIVSEHPGTTTDPVNKVMEVTGLGPIVFIDTAGIDDVGDLGAQRIKKSLGVIRMTDLAILVITDNTFGVYEEGLVSEFEKYNLPFFIVHNKSDIAALDPAVKARIEEKTRTDVLDFCAINPQALQALLDLLKRHLPESVFNNPPLLGDLVTYGDMVILITPIDVQAPKGRIILPQVQVIRDLLDNDCVAIVLKEREVDAFLTKTGIRPRLVITDSQVFLKAAASVPSDIPLTGFSILFARHRGDFEAYLKGTPRIGELKSGDRVLIMESCSHHVAGDDIGRVKIPRWITAFTGKELHFDVAAGLDNPPRPLCEYSLVIQCGGCMLTRRQIINRLMPAIQQGIPVTNYGMAIAYVQGVYERAIAPFVAVSKSGADYL